MRELLGAPAPLTWGVAAVALAVGIAAYLLLAPRPVRLAVDRRRPATPGTTAPGTAGSLAGATTTMTGLIDRQLRRRPGHAARVAALERAGLTIRLQDFVLLVIAGALAAVALGVLLGRPLLGLLLGLAVPLLARAALTVLAERRRRAFADQLDDALQLLASSLRAGHSLPQALKSLAAEAEEPMRTEVARVVNETRVGRPLGQALEETGRRMESEDFGWATQAIAINREVGGNLADVLDGVATTIRERNQIRRQVKALSAEGRLSALVLMLLPVGVVGFLSIANPGYLARFTEGPIGWAMIAVAALLLLAGGLWLRKAVRIAF